MPTSLNKGRPVVLDEPNSEVAQAEADLKTSERAIAFLEDPNGYKIELTTRAE